MSDCRAERLVIITNVNGIAHAREVTSIRPQAEKH